MRPFYHPSLDDITVEGLLHALSDPVRVRLLAEIVARDRPQACCTLSELSGQTLPKSTLSAQFRVLREAGLITSERKGVEVHNTPRCKELEGRFGPMIQAILDAYARQKAEKSNG